MSIASEHPSYIRMLTMARNLTPIPPAQSNREMWQQGVDELDEDPEPVRDEDILDSDATLPGIDVGILKELLAMCKANV